MVLCTANSIVLLSHTMHSKSAHSHLRPINSISNSTDVKCSPKSNIFYIETTRLFLGTCWMNHNKSTNCLNFSSFVFIVNSIELFSFFIVLIVSMVGLRQPFYLIPNSLIFIIIIIKLIISELSVSQLYTTRDRVYNLICLESKNRFQFSWLNNSQQEAHGTQQESPG